MLLARSPLCRLNRPSRLFTVEGPAPSFYCGFGQLASRLAGELFTKGGKAISELGAVQPGLATTPILPLGLDQTQRDLA